MCAASRRGDGLPAAYGPPAARRGGGAGPARPAPGGVEPTANHPRKRWPHLPASPEDDHVPFEPLKSLDDAARGAGKVLLESRDVGEGFEHGERVGN
jgi:hypothetical protein